MKKVEIDTDLYMYDDNSANAIRALAQYDLPVAIYYNNAKNKYLLRIGGVDGSYVMYNDYETAKTNFVAIAEVYDIMVRNTLLP